MAIPERKSSSRVEADESGPWCIDFGNTIDVKRTAQIREALSRGELSPDHKAWRDGRACWLPIADLPELTQDEQTIPPVDQSHIRPIVRPPPIETDDEDDDDALPIPLVRGALVAFLALLAAMSCIAIALAQHATSVQPLTAHVNEHILAP